MRISLVEVFRSVQGEGYNAGRAAIFVRFAGCNLACRFADHSVCDTPYQHATIKVDSVDELFTKHILPLVGNTPLTPPKTMAPPRDDAALMLILTGGEPTMAPAFDVVVDRAHSMGFYVAVETNGTRWRDSLRQCDWVCCSPKENVAQGSGGPYHNKNPQSPEVSKQVRQWLEMMAHKPSGEYRFVITGADAPKPPGLPAFRHYVSPAVLADGIGLEWKLAFPGFVPGALERCLDIVEHDPRWRISVQQHKLWKVR